tara:strand:- start:3913 stop:5076 length:1164 start_codon:yes stop_codon:yes gene_type:complete
MERFILHYFSSDFGKPSSIGYRSLMIYKQKKVNIICRMNASNHKKIISILPVYLLSRLFNFIRIYIWTGLPARKIEVGLFNIISIPYIIYFAIRHKAKTKIIHLWDSHLWFIYFLKNMGYKIIFDIAMTPSYASIMESKKNPLYYNDKTTNKKDVKIEKKILKNAEFILCPSEYTYNFISKFYKIDKYHLKIIPFGVDKKIFSNNYFNSKKDNTTKLGFVGAINMRKGIRWLIEVLNKINKKDKFKDKFELNLYGKIFKEELKFLRKANFKIVTHGFVNNYKKNIFNNFDILIHPSFIEGSAKCIYEAMASGLPIICTKQSGSVVENEQNGYIVDAGDNEKLQEKIEKLILNKNTIERMGKVSRNISNKYTWENYAQNVLKVYDENI